MDRCSVGFWTGDPNIFPPGEGQLGTITLGPETPASLGENRCGCRWGVGGKGGRLSPPLPQPPSASQPLTPDCTQNHRGSPEKRMQIRTQDQ